MFKVIGSKSGAADCTGTDPPTNTRAKIPSFNDILTKWHCDPPTTTCGHPNRRLSGQRVRHFGDLEPTQLGRFDVRAMAGDALGELGKAIGIAGIKVGIVERGLIGGNGGFKTFDLGRKAIVIALVLVG